MPQFSIIIATRDRPELFAEALESVKGQSFSDTEIIVVNDGSSPECIERYQPVIDQTKAELGDRFQFHTLVHRPRGHGQSYSFNYGVDKAQGEFIGFLDDDDTWTDMGHLQRAADSINDCTGRSNQVDLYMSNQAAFLLGKQKEGPIWLEGVEEDLKSHGRTPFIGTYYEITISDLMRSVGFCHLNNFIIRRALYKDVGGMDEGIRWECDRDIFLRLIDKAKTILFAPPVISRHNIPDPSKSNNMTTAVSMLEKRLFQVRVLDKAALFADSPEIRRHGHQHKTFALKKIAEELAETGRTTEAARYAREALGAGLTVKWLLYTVWLSLRSATSS